jgi:nucleoside phosphorylase
MNIGRDPSVCPILTAKDSPDRVMPVAQDEPQTVLVVTALDVETKAVLRHVGEDWTEEVDGTGTVYYRGRFENWEVVVVEAGPGNTSTAVLASVAAVHFSPNVSLFVGVGGGIKDVKLGDVVVATKVHGYEAGKDTAGGFKPRPDLDRGGHPLTQRARAMRKRNEWHQRLNPDLSAVKPELFVEPIAAGEKVVASQRSETAKLIKKHYSDAIAVEMEGLGFLEAAHVHATIAVVIRGISDLLSKKAAADKKGWQKRAADAASAVAFEMLHKLSSAQPLAAPKKRQLPAANQPAKRVRPKTTRSARQKRSTHAAPVPAAPPPAPASPAPFLRMPHTLNEGAFFGANEVLARVGVPGVDEVQFLFQELPDGFIRLIPRIAKAQPIATAALLVAAQDAPLLKHRQYGALASLNRYGALAYDPGGPHHGGPAPLAWGTQLFPNGELWLASNTLVVRERGGRPAWVPIPFIPALLMEQTFYQKTHAAVAFAASRLGLTFPADIEFGVLGLEDVHLAVRDEDIRGPIQIDKVLSPHKLTSDFSQDIDRALLGFFNQLYDATGYARPDNLFGFPPNPPQL